MRISQICLAALPGLLAPALHAATPSSGTVSDASPTASWSGPTPPVANPSGSTCSSPSDPACDNFQLTIAPPQSQCGFTVNIAIASTVGPNDCYYLSVFDASGKKIAGPVLDNSSSANTVLRGPAAGVYTVSVAQALDQAAVAATCSGAAGAYSGKAVLGCLSAPARLGVGPPMARSTVVVGTAGNEPQITAAPDGKTLYIGALQHLYVSTDNGQTWNPSPGTPYNGTANVASDSSTDIDSNGRMYFSFDYPYAGQVAVCGSNDKAQTFTCDQAANPGSNDRMWVATPQPGNVYLTTNAGLYKTVFLASHDSGATFTPQKTVDVTSLEVTIGAMLTNPKDHRLYQPVDSGGGLSVLIWDPTNSSTSPEAKPSTGLGGTHALPSLAATSDGTMYAVSDSAETVNVARSTDLGKTWTTLAPVPTATTGASVFAWIAAGKAPGHIGVIWYHTDGKLGDASAVWDVYWAETWTADTTDPLWFVNVIDKGVHTGNICSAISCSGNDRFAGDFISATFGANEVPYLSWMGQHTVNGAQVTEVRSLGPNDRIFGDLIDGFGFKQYP